MAKEVYQQVAERFQEAERVLIAFPWADSKESGDALGSALALYRYLDKLGKKVEVVASGFSPSARFAFLPHIQIVRSEISRDSQYTVRINTEGAPIKNWSYGLKEGALEIYLTPQQGAVRSEDISIHHANYPYDTVITLDTPDLPSLGKLFEDHADLFYHTPILNIDHHAENEQYGQINMVDLNAAATGEIIAELFKKVGGQHFDEQIATNLFAAIFLKTGGFKHPSITPNTLKLAAELIQLGARREEIMKNIFRSRSLASLRLWGKALAHLKFDPQIKLAWSTLTMREIIESGGDLKDLPDVIEELIFTSPEARLVALIHEEEERRTCVLLATRKSALAPRALPWQMIESAPGRTSYCIFGKNLVEAEREVIGKLEGMLKLLPHS